MHAVPSSESDLSTDLLVEVITDSISESPIKAEAMQHLVVGGEVTPQNIEHLLLRRFERAMATSNLRHHEELTSVHFYAYETREQAESGQGLWFAMLSMAPGSEGEPGVYIRDEVLAEIGKPPQSKLGLSESERRSIYKQLVAAERRSTQDAERKHPSDLMKKIDYEDVLLKQYQAEIASASGISREQVMEIILEGVMSRWPSR
ncbi:unnamed protein product [Ectocarpus fasciculatus]